MNSVKSEKNRVDFVSLSECNTLP